MRFTNLSMDALRTFVSGVDAGSFARAADRLGRSTSAVSAQLKKLEEQVGVLLLKKSGRGLVLTDAGEALLSYARRLLDLNDEAVSAIRGVELEGWIRLGLQEDFGETILPEVLGRFARAHPKVRIEGQICRNQELEEKIASGQLDLALAWDSGAVHTSSDHIASLPLCWIGSVQREANDLITKGHPLPLVAIEAPCRLRTLACEALDRQGLAWRVTFVSPSLSGLWAATAAGLGIALRTQVGLPHSLCTLDAKAYRLPDLGSLGIILHRSDGGKNSVCDHLATILCQTVQDVVQKVGSTFSHKT